MKVICIKIPPTVVRTEIIIGKIYDTFQGLTGRNIYTYIEDEIGNLIPVDNKYFITLEKYREEQINNILYK